MVITYPAVFRQKEDGTYEGYFPDLEKCYFSGDTLDEAINDAIAAEKEWIAVELEDESAGLPYVSDSGDMQLKDGEFVRNIAVVIRITEGWDE